MAQIRDARVKITIDAEEAKRDIDLLRQSIGKETKTVSKIKSTLNTEEKKTKEMMDRGDRLLTKAGRYARAVGARGMRVPDLYGAAISAAAAAGAASVNWVPVAGPPLGGLFRSTIRTVLPFAEYGGTAMTEMVRGMVTGQDKNAFDRIKEGEAKWTDWMQAIFLPGWLGGGMKSAKGEGMESQTMTAVMAIINGIAEGMTELRINQANMEMMLKNVGSAVKTDLALDMDMDMDFLRNMTNAEWRVADATNRYRMAFEKIVRMRAGENLGIEFGKMLSKGTRPRGN